jgi:circadian clock protein KaiB
MAEVEPSGILPQLSGRHARRSSAVQKPLLKLYITGQTTRSERAIANLRRIFEDTLDNDYELVIIDVLEQPHLAEADRVLVTPTLIKQVPPPPRRVLGDLSDIERVLAELHVQPSSALGTPAEGR